MELKASAGTSPEALHDKMSSGPLIDVLLELVETLRRVLPMAVRVKTQRLRVVILCHNAVRQARLGTFCSPHLKEGAVVHT